MASASNITLTDAAGTPVNHTFIPQDITSEVAKYVETASGISIGMPVLDLSLKLGRNGQANRVTGKLTLPVLETVSGQDVSGYVAVPQVAFACIGKFELVMPQRSSLQNRKDLKAMVIDAMGDAVITAMVQTFERPF